MERYIISKNLNTSYDDVGKMTPEERKLILSFIREQMQADEQRLKELKEKKGRRK